MIKDLNNVLQNKNMKYIVILVALCYIFTLQYIDRDLLEVINSLAFRVVYSIVVIYISQVSPSISIILFIFLIYILIQPKIITNYYAVNFFGNILNVIKF